MVDTLQALRGEMGARPLCLMLGMDAFLGLPGWHRWEELAELAHLIVMRRPGWDAPTEGPLAALVGSRQAEQPADLARSPAGRLLFCTVTQLEIAATYIRQQLAQGMNPRYLLPDRVLGYLRDEHIYD